MNLWLLFASLAIAPVLIATSRPTADNSTPKPRPEVVRLQELWNVGEDDNAAVVFGQIGDLMVDGAGRLYVADMQARQVSVFSHDGEFLRTLGREGEGPGEFREPRALVVLPDGLVGVVREQPPAIVRFRASDGQFVDNLYLESNSQHPFQRLGKVRCRGNTLVAICSDVRESPGGMDVVARLMRFDVAGKFLGECDSISAQFNFANLVARERFDLGWSMAPDGTVFVNPGLKYHFEVRGLDCQVKQVIEPSYQPLKRTSAEIDSVRAFYQRVGNIGHAKLELLENVRDVAWFSVDDEGRLWVLSSRGRLECAADSLGWFDVYDRHGRLDRVLDLKGERGPKDGFLMDGERLYVVHRDTMAIVAYRMPKLGSR